MTREQILALATEIHDNEWDCTSCDRHKYRHSCPRFVTAVLEAGKRLNERVNAS